MSTFNCGRCCSCLSLDVFRCLRKMCMFTIPFACGCRYTCVCVCVAHMSMHAHMHVHVCVCVSAHTCVLLLFHVHVSMCTYRYTCVCVLRICCMHAHIHVRACVCVCVCCTLQPKLAHMQACTDRVLVRSAGDDTRTHAETLYGKNEHLHSHQKTTSERCATHCAVDRALVHRGRGRASYIAMAKPSKTQLVTDYIQLEIGRPRMANRMWPCTICTVLARCEFCGCMDGGRRTVDKTVGMTVDAWTVDDGLWTRLWA